MKGNEHIMLWVRLYVGEIVLFSLKQYFKFEYYKQKELVL